MRIKFHAGKAEDDCEKAVTPTIIYASKADDVQKAKLILFGWWHFFIGISFTTKF